VRQAFGSSVGEIDGGWGWDREGRKRDAVATTAPTTSSPWTKLRPTWLLPSKARAEPLQREARSDQTRRQSE